MSTVVVTAGNTSTTYLGSGDVETVQYGGTALSGTVAEGAFLFVSGMASATEILASGTVSVGAGGVGIGLIGSGGPVVVSGGSYSNLALLDVLSGGSVTATQLGLGGNLDIRGGGTASGTVVTSGGYDSVDAGAVASGTMVSGTGLYSSGGASIVAYSNQDVKAGGHAYSTVVDANGIEIVETGGQDSGTVLSGTTLTSTTSGTFGSASEHVSAGGVAIATQVELEGELYVAGSAINAAVTSSGTIHVSSGGTTTGTTLSGSYTLVANSSTRTGVEIVSAGGVASNTQVTDGGVLRLSGGTATGTVVSGNALFSAGVLFALGEESVRSGGLALGTTVYNGGQIDVAVGGIASGSIISGFGIVSAPGSFEATAYEIVSAGGSAVAETVTSGAGQYVRSGGTTTNTTLSGSEVTSSGGTYYTAFELVSTGGIASSTHVGSGGKLSVSGHASGAFVSAAGLETVYAGGVASGSTISGFTNTAGTLVGSATERVSSGGTAVGETVDSGGRQIISAGGLASGATLNVGGSLDVAYLVYSGATSASVDGSDVLTVIEGGASYTEQLAGDYAGIVFHVSQDTGTGTLITAENAPCYCPGTRIRTERGDVAVESLRIGDTVCTLAGGSEPIRWIGRRSYGGRFLAGRGHLLPVLIRAGALGGGLPLRDLRVSPEHALYFDGVLVPAIQLVNGGTIIQLRQCAEVHYLHLELGRHEVIWAEGALAESFVDDESRALFHNASEYAALYPEEAPRAALYYAPRVRDGFELEAIRRRLAKRSAA